jgi:acetyltransferase
VGFHERQDTRYAEAAAEIADRTDTPILVATELANARPDNPGPATLRSAGRLCHASAGRAVRSLDLLAGHADWRRRRGL